MVKRKFTIRDLNQMKKIPLKTKRKCHAIAVYKNMLLKTPCMLFLEDERKYYTLTQNDLEELIQRATELNIPFKIDNGDFVPLV